jgi:hypothetical protein
MATLKTAKCASTVQPRARIGFEAVFETYTLTAALALNDVIQLVQVPKNATILDVIINITDMDTSTGFAFSVGDGNVTDRYIKTSTIGQTGGTVRLGSGITDNACNQYKYTADDTIDLKVTTAATGTAATTGTIGCTVIYTMQS